MVSWPNPWERPLISVEEAGRLLGMSRRTAYRAAADGYLPTIRGRVPVAGLMEMMGLPVPAAPPPRPRIV